MVRKILLGEDAPAWLPWALRRLAQLKQAIAGDVFRREYRPADGVAVTIRRTPTDDTVVVQAEGAEVVGFVPVTTQGWVAPVGDAEYNNQTRYPRFCSLKVAADGTVSVLARACPTTWGASDADHVFGRLPLSSGHFSYSLPYYGSDGITQRHASTLGRLLSVRGGVNYRAAVSRRSSGRVVVDPATESTATTMSHSGNAAWVPQRTKTHDVTGKTVLTVRKAARYAVSDAVVVTNAEGGSVTVTASSAREPVDDYPGAYVWPNEPGVTDVVIAWARGGTQPHSGLTLVAADMTTTHIEADAVTGAYPQCASYVSNSRKHAGGGVFSAPLHSTKKTYVLTTTHDGVDAYNAAVTVVCDECQSVYLGDVLLGQTIVCHIVGGSYALEGSLGLGGPTLNSVSAGPSTDSPGYFTGSFAYRPTVRYTAAPCLSGLASDEELLAYGVCARTGAYATISRGVTLSGVEPAVARVAYGGAVYEIPGLAHYTRTGSSVDWESPLPPITKDAYGISGTTALSRARAVYAAAAAANDAFADALFAANTVDLGGIKEAFTTYEEALAWAQAGYDAAVAARQSTMAAVVADFLARLPDGVRAGDDNPDGGGFGYASRAATDVRGYTFTGADDCDYLVVGITNGVDSPDASTVIASALINTTTGEVRALNDVFGVSDDVFPWVQEGKQGTRAGSFSVYDLYGEL